jgi:stage III sporulation protein AB
MVRLLLRGSGAALLTFCGWYAGALRQHSVRTHRTELEQAERLLLRIRQEIEYRHRALDELYRELIREGIEGDPPCFACFVPPEQRNPQNPQNKDAANASFHALRPPPSFSAEEKACFTECMAALGHTEARQECDRLDFFIARFAQFRLCAEEAERKAAALDRKLGFAGGAVLALLLL